MPIRKYPKDEPVQDQNLEPPRDKKNKWEGAVMPDCMFCGRPANHCKCDDKHDE
jgi:hypothetical protein